MTRKEASIITAYTGILIGNFADFHKYAEDVLNRTVFTHEFASRELLDEIKSLSKYDFFKVCESVSDED